MLSGDHLGFMLWDLWLMTVYFTSVRQRSRQARRGIVTLEFLGVFPLLLIFGLSIAQFSMAARLNQRVIFASRYGAKLASEMPRAGSRNVGNFNARHVSGNLKSHVDSWLQASGLSEASEVILEHNVCGATNTLQRLGTDAGNKALPPLPAAWNADNVNYVRVTVAVPVVPNLPNMLKTFGLDWSGVVFRHSTVFRMETDNAPPVPAITVDAHDLPSGVRLLPEEQNAKTNGDQPAPLRLATSRSGPVTVTLSGAYSRDVEDGLGQMAFQWNVPGAAKGSTNGASVRMKLDLPKNGTVVQQVVTLTVTDSCQCSRKAEVPVELVPEPTPDPLFDRGAFK